MDPSGAAVSIPENIDSIVVLAPSIAETVAALAPDVLFVSSLSLYGQEAPYQPLIDAGVCVICVTTSESIDGVKSDIAFLAAGSPTYAQRIWLWQLLHVGVERGVGAGALCGGTFLVLCDLAARTLTPPHEIPIGSITALLGAPFFLYIFFVGRKRR